MKPRHHVYLDEDLSERLDALSAKPGSSKSAIVADALRAYFDQRAARDIDTLLGQRLDRINKHLGHLERDGRVLLETVALFVQYELTANAPRPEPDKAMQAIGRDRFETFIAQVGRRIASGQPTVGDHQDAEREMVSA